MTLLITNDYETASSANFADETIVDTSSRALASRGTSRVKPDAVPAHVERRLAAILAADVAGYSRLVGADGRQRLIPASHSLGRQPMARLAEPPSTAAG